MEYKGPHLTVKCPECKKEMELFVNGFEDGEITPVRHGAFRGDINRVRSDHEGCKALIGVKIELIPKVTLFKMEKVKVKE